MADITYELIKKSLDASALRQRVIAHNIANINTKGFKRSEVVFEDTLKKELDKRENSLSNIDSIKPEVKTDYSTSMREDGNNINIDLEMANMAANSLLFNTLVTQFNTKLSVMRYVINEGRK